MNKIIGVMIITISLSNAQAMHRESFIPIDTKDETVCSKISPRNTQQSPERPLQTHLNTRQSLENAQFIEASLLAAYKNRKISCSDDEQPSR